MHRAMTQTERLTICVQLFSWRMNFIKLWYKLLRLGKCAVGKQKPPFWHWKKSLDLALLANSLFLYYGEKVVKTCFFGIDIPTESLEKRKNQYFWHFIFFEDYCDWYPGGLKLVPRVPKYFFI